MPVIKFDQLSTIADNCGSCRKFIEYLSKEDEWKGFEKEFFFNEENQFICDYEVISAIDNNRKRLGKEDAKFFTGSINFSENELAFIGNDLQKIKEYAIQVMEEYASNYNKGLSINKINWFAKLETNRYYKGDDPKVLDGTNKQGDVKPGNNIHIHFIIGRKSRDNMHKLSPITNHQNTMNGPVKGGFSRDKFKETCEILFDKKFQYNRPFEDTYQNLKANKHGSFSDKVNIMDAKATLISDRIKYSQLPSDEKILRLDKLIKYIEYGINRDNPLRLDGEELLIQEVRYWCDGTVYQVLMNLNIKMKNGYQPDPLTIMDTILKNAEFLHELKMKKSINDEGISLNQNVQIQTLPDQHISDLINPTIDMNDTIIQHRVLDDELPSYLKRKKKNQNRSRDNI